MTKRIQFMFFALLTIVQAFYMCKPTEKIQQLDLPDPMALMPPESNIPVSTSVTFDSTTSNGNVIRCTTEHVTVAPGSDQAMILNPNAQIYAGMGIIGQSVPLGSYEPFTAERKVQGISCSLPGAIPTATSEWSRSNIKSIRDNMVAEALSSGNNLIPAQVSLEIKQIGSESEALLAVEGNYKSSIAEVEALVKSKFDGNRTNVFVNFSQVYYTMVVDDWDNIDEIIQDQSDLNDLTYSPAFIKSTTWGRRGIFIFSTDYSAEEFENSLKAVINGVVTSGSASVNYEDREIIRNSSMEALVIGGNSDDAVQVINGFEPFIEWIENGGQVTQQSPGSLIGFTVAGNNGGLLRLVNALEYERIECDDEPFLEDKIVEIPDQILNKFQKRCFTHIAGDRDFDGSVKATFTAELEVASLGKELFLTIEGDLKQLGGDQTEGIDKETFTIYSVPEGFKIDEIVTLRTGVLSHVDADHSLDIVESISPEALFNNVQFMGDGEGTDLPANGGPCVQENYSWWTPTFNQIIVKIKKE